MGKRETKESYNASKDIQKDATERYDELYDQTQDRVPTGDEGGSEGSSEGGGGGEVNNAAIGGSFVSPFAGQTGGNYGDITGDPWTRGSGDEGRSSNINDIRGKWGGPSNPGEGSTSAGSQRDALTGGYTSIMNNIGKLKDPDKIGTQELTDTLGQYKTFRDTGGLSEENIARMRGGGIYDEFSKTGGYTPESIANIKAQALRPIGSYATGTRDELSRRAAVQGGYSPGFDAASRQLQRDTARNIAATSLDANVGIQDRINQGRMWGGSNVSNAENAVAGMQTGNRLGALAGEQGIGNNLSGYRAEDINNAMNADRFNIENTQNMKLSGLAGLGGLYEGTMGRGENAYNRELAVQQNALDRGLTSSENAYNRYHQTDENALNRSLTAQEGGLNRGWQSGENALNRGFSGGQADYDRQLAILNGMFGQRNQGLNQQSQLGMQPGIGGNIMAGIGAGAGIASSFLPSGGAIKGLGGLGGGIQPNQYANFLNSYQPNTW